MLLITPSDNRYELVNSLAYKDIVVPSGYKTDGITYKLRIIGFIIDRFDPRFIEAAIVHDYMTDYGLWDKGAEYFEELLPDCWQKPLMVTAVKMYGEFKK